MENDYEINDRFARIWRVSREKAGVSQDAIAKRLGVSKKTVQNWENGTSSPSQVMGFEWFNVCELQPLPFYLEALYPEYFSEYAPKEEVKQAYTLFAGGSGTKDDPYLIATANQWIAMCSIYDYYGNGTLYMIYQENGVYVRLINDIDLAGYTLPVGGYVYALDLDGNNKTVKNINSVNVFSSSSCNFYDDCNIYDITFENCTTSQGLLGNSTSSSRVVTLNFKNVDAKNCKTNANGGMLSQASSAKITFEDCDLTGMIVNGSYYGCGGFIGNNSTGTNVFKNCTFGGKISSDSGQVGGFIGQGANYSETAIKIENCTVLAGSIIRSVGGGSVCAYDGHNGSHNYGTSPMTAVSQRVGY